MVNDIEALNWGNFDIHDASHIAIMHFRPVLYAVRSANSPLYCRVEERFNFIKTGEKILFSDGSILASSQPLYIMYLSPKDIEKKFIDPKDSEQKKLQDFEK